MKAALENVQTIKGKDAFVAYGFTLPFFDFKWHYHPEYELTLITEGFGKRIIGDSHDNFVSGDLVLIGPELPHTWSNEKFGARKSSAVVIQFTREFSQRFSTLHEGRNILDLLERSSRGSFFPHPDSELIEKILALPDKTGISKITALLEILEKLCGTESTSLSKAAYSGSRNPENATRINKVCRYVYENAAQEISLEQAAALVSLSKSAFCKFFGRTMNTNFSDYVNEIRIANACLLLADSDKTVREIASDSGFESLTYFNRVFLKKKGLTPVKFRDSVAKTRPA
ncbi:AraC family transcriptional regulator [Flavobacterium selenitireducens]|uniref:AraC family transcriptional regulator n=1 Tax=Flavobacterium selenitireducens TaxID=2722704 RepID=UPI00168C0D7C|nr:AraC family transcriptional regulator [Flavobacterium selenitireducens]MBD3582493.1 AraC family transcriptional regulator [Flavobacterium selenitireducens]